MDMTTSAETTFRLSLTWIVIGLAILFAVGMAGGLATLYFFSPLEPLTPSADRVVTTVQEVTISPNTAISDVLSRIERSIVLLGPSTNKTVEATGVVVTNDGVVVTPAIISGSQPSMYDDRGVAIPLQLIGRDEVFGLTYYRISTGVFPALDMRSDDPSVGHELLVLSRSKISFQPRIHTWKVQEYLLPTLEVASGIQRLLLSSVTSSDAVLTGSPLIDDAGKIAGIVTEPGNGLGITTQQLQDSLNRVVQEKREFNPFKNHGLAVRYTFVNPIPTEPVVFAAQITAITPGGKASAASLHTGDYIIEVDGQPLQWEKSVSTILSKTLPFSITVLRDGQKQTVTLSANPS